MQHHTDRSGSFDWGLTRVEQDAPRLRPYEPPSLAAGVCICARPSRDKRFLAVASMTELPVALELARADSRKTVQSERSD